MLLCVILFTNITNNNNNNNNNIKKTRLLYNFIPRKVSYHYIGDKYGNNLFNVKYYIMYDWPICVGSFTRYYIIKQILFEQTVF